MAKVTKTFTCQDRRFVKTLAAAIVLVGGVPDSILSDITERGPDLIPNGIRIFVRDGELHFSLVLEEA